MRCEHPGRLIMFRRPLPPDLLATVTAMNKRLAYEEEVSATPLGRQSWELRQRALSLVRAGRQPEAFKLYAEAANLHAEDDPSPAAAMCWYDLAETYTRRADGVRLANLGAAESL